MYHHLLGKGYTKFQAEVLINRITQKTALPVRLKPQYSVDDASHDDVSILQTTKPKINDIVMIQADQKTLNAIMRRKKQSLKTTKVVLE